METYDKAEDNFFDEGINDEVEEIFKTTVNKKVV